MRLCIPAVGDILTLTEAWTFPLHYEHRNSKFLYKLGLNPDEKSWWHNPQPAPAMVTLPVGLRLRLDRVYIKKATQVRNRYGFGMNLDGDFNSLTFRVIDAPKGSLYKGARFWVKLRNANEMECEVERIVGT